MKGPAGALFAPLAVAGSVAFVVLTPAQISAHRSQISATGRSSTSMSAPSPSVSKITVKSQKPKEVKARRARLLKNPDCVALIAEAVAAAKGGGECADCKQRAAELIVELRENARLRGELSQAFIDQRKLVLEKSEATREHSETMAMLMENFNQVHDEYLKYQAMARDYRKWLDEAKLKIAKQHGRTRTGGKPGRPRKQPKPSPPKEVMKITPRKRKRAKVE